MSPNVRFNNHLLTQLPQQNLNDPPSSLDNDFMQPFDRQLMWLVGPGKQPDPSVTERWLASLHL
ncbi:MAG: hypothetical protein AB8W78_07665 [Arsenophonus endosymbiont of Dermacentor nuttalli]